MSYCAEERETLIRMDELDDFWIVETNVRTMLTKLKKLTVLEIIDEEVEDGRVIAGTYRLPSNAISIGNGRAKREYSEEERKVMSERAKANFHS